MNKGTISSSHIGEFKCKIVDIVGQGPGMEHWHEFYHKGKKCGTLLIRTKWVD
jgi:hypothetical protein